MRTIFFEKLNDGDYIRVRNAGIPHVACFLNDETAGSFYHERISTEEDDG